MTEIQSKSIIYLLVGLASIFIISWGIKASAFILNPILLATVITIVVLPMPQKLTKKGLPSWLSFVLTLVVVVGSIALLVLLFVLSVTKFTGDISSQISALTRNTFRPEQVTASSTGLEVIETIIGFVGNGIFQMFIVLMIFIFMLGSAISLPAKNRPGLRTDNPVLKSVADLTQDVRHYMSIMTVVNFLVGVGDTILLIILGVEYAVVWGILAWAMGYIPTVGFWIALIPPLILAWTANDAETAMIVLGGYVLINGSVQNFVQPRLMGRGMGISAVVVFLSLFVWGWLLGGIGAILAVPLTMIIITVLKSFDNTRWIATLMSQSPDDKDDDHQAARNKMRGLWGETKQFFRGKKATDQEVPTEAKALKQD